MANKRQLKKYMKDMAANIAGETIFILNFYDGIDETKANDVIDKVFYLLTEKINDVSVAYDKTCKEFYKGDRKTYRKEKTAYYKKCYRKLYTDFNDGINEILKDMNALLSKEQLEENKRVANA